ncbi:MAG TPA: hypothetical protein PLW66_10335 [Saprospiraceae bacterium]|nr:hypothetical protein [Saprospiraceae bacterium]
MKNSLLAATALAVAVFACTRLAQTTAPSGDPPIKNCFCADSTRCNDLCSSLPIDVLEKFNPGYSGALTPTFQPPFDIFSWQTFIALNWPSDARGAPLNCPLNEHPNAPRVWERYVDAAALFQHGDAPLLLAIDEAAAKGQKFFYRFSKSPHPLNNGIAPGRTFDDEDEEADGHALIDRNLNFALFEIRVNPDEADFIRNNHLGTLPGIDTYYRAHKDSFSLPASAFPSTAGAMEIKASWRILDPALGDDTTRYYTRDAIIQVPKQNSATGQAFQVKAKVGLVGMHIIRKTGNFAFLIWSTFEHIDNTPDDVQAAQTNQDARRWSFYNVECLTCPVDSPPVLAASDSGHYKWNPTPPYAARYATGVPGEQGGKVFGTQVTRTYPIYYRTQQVNQLWQTKLGGTVWANYRLVGTQWTVPNDGGTSNTINVPFRLGNTTLETYIQENASCIQCHGFAGVIAGKDTISTDFSFIFGMAKK